MIMAASIRERRHWRGALSLGTAAIAAAAFPAGAQTAAPEQTAQAAPADGGSGDDIIVTATKRATSIKDVPFSINAQTEQDIARANAGTLEDLSRNVAGLTIQNLGPGQSQVAVRGVSAGQIARDQPGVKEQVGIYLDETVVSLSLFTPDLDLFDLNRVETLRGPQGTLFGSGSVGGTIRYITNQPTTERVEGKVEANVNLVAEDDVGGHIKGAINLPLGSAAAVRAVGYYTRYGGFIDALREGGGRDDNVNSGERYGGRVALLLEPTPDLTITPRVLYQKITTGGFNRQEVYNLYANRFTTTRPAIQLGEREQYLLRDESFSDRILIGDATVAATLGVVDVTAVTSYTHRDILVSRDASALSGSVSADLGFSDAGILLPANLRDRTKLEQFTQELRLASNGSGPFQWLFGGFYAYTDRRYKQTLPTPGYDAATDAALGAGTAESVRNGFQPDSPYNASIPYVLQQLAIFSELNYDLTDRLTATAGLRYYAFNEERTFTSGGLYTNLDGNRDRTQSDGFNPRFLLKYALTDQITLNAQAAKGFRLGGVNDPLNLPLCRPADAATFGGYPRYDDESLWNYEGGVKVQAGAFRFNAAGFYTDIRNLQVTADAGSCSSRVVFNVARAHTVGAELELGATPFAGFDLSVSGSVVDAQFGSTLTRADGSVIEGIRDGNRLPSVPRFQVAGSATYTFAVGATSDAFLSAAIQHVGSRFTQPGDQENNPRTFVPGFTFGGAPASAATVLDLELPAYQLVNLSAGVTLPSRLELSIYVNNLLDENALLAFDRERGGRARLGFSVSQPRTIGLTARQSF
jgi:iron complex outermembrane recepter protein